MDRFIDDIEEDIKRGVYISGFRALVGIENNITLGGDYITDVNSKFSELFLNGTLDGVNSSIMLNNTFKDWMKKMEAEAVKTDIVINFTLNSISLSQDDPWNIRVDTNVYIDITDKRNTSHWSKEEEVITHIEIDGFEDPIYRVQTQEASYSNKIEKSNYSYFVSGNDISNLLDHIEKGYYVAFSGAPSYLMRLEGNLSASEYGIESLVNADESPWGDNSGSIVDYYYFDEYNNPDSYRVNSGEPSPPEWLRIDNETNMYSNLTHIEIYQIEDLLP